MTKQRSNNKIVTLDGKYIWHNMILCGKHIYVENRKEYFIGSNKIEGIKLGLQKWVEMFFAKLLTLAIQNFIFFEIVIFMHHS